MEKTPQITKFHDHLKTNKRKTFSDMKKKKTGANQRPIDYFESRKGLVWENHSYCTGTKFADEHHPFTPSWSTPLGLVDFTWPSEKALQGLPGIPVTEKCAGL